MRALRLAVLGISCGLVVAPGVARGGDDTPLVVAVEVDEGAAVDAAQIRKAIAAELGRPVVAPGEVIAKQGAEVALPICCWSP